MAISVTGSGLDIPTLVSNLVSAARTPTETRINNAGTTANAKLSAIGQIKSGLTNLQTALNKLTTSSDTPAYTATAASDAGFTATASSKAVAGSYSVQVKQLATAQKLATDTGLGADATVGSGTLTISYGTGDDRIDLDVEIGSEDTLATIASKVNKAAGGNGVTASVITATDATTGHQVQHLVFSAASTGTDGALTITSSDDSLKALTTTEGGLKTQVAAQNAIVTVDGLERVSSSNNVADLVPGVTLNLTKAADSAQTLTVTTDATSLKSNITAFVSAYNSVMSTLKTTSAYNADTDTAAALTGDSLVRSLQQQLRGQVSANITELKALGITLDKSGTMSFDSTTFDTAYAVDPDAATSLFGKESSLGSGLGKLFTTHLDTYSGTLVQRSNTLNKQIASLEDELDRLDERMTKLSNQYTAQFTAMETMVQQLQSSASSLNSLLSSD